MAFTASRRRFPYQDCSEKEMFPAKTVCDICGRTRQCCTYGEFENGVHSVCADCFRKGRAAAKVPEAVASQIYGPDAKEKVDNLRHTPPIYWSGQNQWPCCCNDFMIYQGSWEEYTRRDPELEDNFRNFYMAAQEDLNHPIEDVQEVYLDLPFIYTDHVFRCPRCGKRSILLQRYFDEQEIAEYEKDREGFRKRYFPGRTADMYELYGNKKTELHREKRTPPEPEVSGDLKIQRYLLWLCTTLCGGFNAYLMFTRRIAFYHLLPWGLALLSVLLSLGAFFLSFQEHREDIGCRNGELTLRKLRAFISLTVDIPLIGCCFACLPMAIDVRGYLQLFRNYLSSAVTILSFAGGMAFLGYLLENKTRKYRERMLILRFCLRRAAIWSLCFAAVMCAAAGFFL